jgi:hypothetical protein
MKILVTGMILPEPARSGKFERGGKMINRSAYFARFVWRCLDGQGTLA